MVTRIAPRTHAELARSSGATAVRPRDAVAGRDEGDRGPVGRWGPVPRDRVVLDRPAVRGGRAALFVPAERGDAAGSDGRPRGLGVEDRRRGVGAPSPPRVPLILAAPPPAPSPDLASDRSGLLGGHRRGAGRPAREARERAGTRIHRGVVELLLDAQQLV